MDLFSLAIYLSIAIIFLLFVSRNKHIKTFVRSYTYDFWLGTGPTNTPHQYRLFLTQIQDGARILDVGCGNGACLTKEDNSTLIKQKNLKIDGIDIDADYLSICQKRIEQEDLEQQYKCQLQDLFQLKKDQTGYDYVLFMESYPVIPKEHMKSMILHSTKLLSKNGKIVFIHNLLESKELLNSFPALIKPYIKYIPFVWVDFGRATTQEEFQQFLTDCGLQFTAQCILRIKLGDLVNSFFNWRLATSFFKFLLRQSTRVQYEITQYIYSGRPIETAN